MSAYLTWLVLGFVAFVAAVVAVVAWPARKP